MIDTQEPWTNEEIHERHELTLFSDVRVWIEFDAEGRAAMFFRQTGDDSEERDYPISFDADNWSEVTMFWNRVTRADE